MFGLAKGSFAADFRAHVTLVLEAGGGAIGEVGFDMRAEGDFGDREVLPRRKGVRREIPLNIRQAIVRNCRQNDEIWQK